MIRRLFNIASAVSLLLFVAIGALWVRSCTTADFADLSSEFVEPRHGPGPDHVFGRERTIVSSAGLIQFTTAERLHIGYVFVDIDNPGPTDGHWIRQWTSQTDLPSKLSNPTLTTMPATLLNRLGFRLDHEVISSPTELGHIREAVVPYWFLSLSTGILPAVVLVRFAKARLRYPRFCCAACGYNLTGNTSGVCPECGTPKPANVGGQP